MTSQTNQSPSAVLRQRAERAIKLAAQSQWDDAARENLQIIQMYPAEDNGIDLIRKNRPEQFRHYLDAHNRLGKAFTEMGRYGDARSVYGKTRADVAAKLNAKLATRNQGLPEPTGDSPPSRVTVRDINGRVLSAWGGDRSGDTDPCAPGNFFAAHGIWVDRHGTVYVGEVTYSGNGREGQGGGAGWVPSGCHAFQRFRPA